MTNIEVFQDTISRINADERLVSATLWAIDNTAVFGENFLSQKRPKASSRIRVAEELTLIAAEKAAAAGKKTAVLNFANPFEPGGGVLRGANAQEEYLCRASNLWPCLVSPQAKAFYEFHRNLPYGDEEASFFLASDRIVYTKNATVIRKDTDYVPGHTAVRSTQEYSDQWYQIDVITCAAPYFAKGRIPIGEEQLKELLKKRIRNIMEVSIENNVQALVLGAFGCGAFHNPPTVVASAFWEVLGEQRYAQAFEEVVFAIKRTDTICENIEAFRTAFLLKS